MDNNTNVINLFGGSGIGKSTTAAGLFYEMKLRGVHCELVREYVKAWAWQNRKVGPYDQTYIFGKQSQAESQLYHKAAWLVTDSPLYLSPIYETFYAGKSMVEKSVNEFIEKANASGVARHNFILERHKPFDTRGRYETEEQARRVDDFVKEYLTKSGVQFTIISAEDRERVPTILNHLGL